MDDDLDPHRLRDRFLALVSHELRTPLNGISSWAQVLTQHLETAAVPPDGLVTRALRGIRLGVDQQTQLIEDLLDTTMALDGRLQLAPTPVVLGRLVERTVAAQRDSATQRDVALVVDDRLGACLVAADERRLARALLHLLDNAIKFASSGGRVTVAAGVVAGRARLCIEDDGEGIPDQFRAALFSPFMPADDSSERRSGGIGIGLALSRLVIELHGGRIEVSDRPAGPGTVVAIELPVLEPAIEHGPVRVVEGSHELPATSLADLEILVIDDQLEAREALSALLRQFGARVRVSTSVREGLDAASVEARPDAVLCDIAMPDEDGHVFLRRFREFERRERSAARLARRRTPVIAVSAFLEADASPDRGWHGFDDHLTKPVVVEDLIERIVRATGRA